MDVITRVKGTARPNDLPEITVPLPIYVRVMLLLTAVIAVLVVGWTIPLSQGTQPSNPFSDYIAILPGQTWNSVVAQPFSCYADNSVDNTAYCTRSPASGPFSLIAVIVSDGVVSRIDLAVREGTLTVGDLALLWGRPNARLYRQSVNLDWPSVGVTASSWAESRRFGYFIPIIRLSFAQSSDA
jgi:hypothetical protein